MNITQLEQENAPFAALFVGRSGSGKTGALASLASLGPLKIYDIDKRARGILGCKNWLPEEEYKQIEIIRDIDITKGFTDLDRQLEIDLIKQRQGQFPFKTLAFESSTTLLKLLIADSQKLRSSTGKDGKVRGAVRFFHPDDYNYASVALHKIIYQVLLPMKINVVMSAWIVDRWGKPVDADDYAESEVIGSKVLGTDKWSEELPGYFDEVYQFEKQLTGIASDPLRYTVQFESDLAKTSCPWLKGKGKVDITRKNFWKVMQSLRSAEGVK